MLPDELPQRPAFGRPLIGNALDSATGSVAGSSTSPTGLKRFPVPGERAA